MKKIDEHLGRWRTGRKAILEGCGGHPGQLPGARLTRVRGVVLIITLLSIILIAALISYLMNITAHTNSRIMAQNAADATAIGGATWVARSFNSVAMNNVMMAKCLALINVLDAMPLTAKLTMKDHVSFTHALNDQINGSSGRSGISDPWIMEMLTKYATMASPGEGGDLPNGLMVEYEKEIDNIKTMDVALNQSGFDIGAYTMFNGPGGKGKLWSAITTLDEYNRATMDNLSVLAQLSAGGGGLANSHTTNADSFMVPILLPTVPLRASRFEDFKQPVQIGRLPPGTDDPITNRGPYDTIMGWRIPGVIEPARYDPGNSTIVVGGRGNLPISAGIWPRPAHMIIPPSTYHTYGPKTILYNKMGAFAWKTLNWYMQARFLQHLSDVSEPKFGYMFDDLPVQTVHDSEFVIDFDEATRIHQANPNQISETCFLYLGIKSRFPRLDPRFLTKGTWMLTWCEVETAKGYVNPGDKSMIDRWIWRDEWEYQVSHDPNIDNPAVARPGSIQSADMPLPPSETVYRIDEFIFLGCNIGGPVAVRNPSNFASRADLPAPTDFDHKLFKNDTDTRSNFLTYLGVSRLGFEAPMMGSLFDKDRAYPNTVGIAQAKVFNDHSWDLWTQMWHAELTPVSDVKTWNTMLSQGVSDCHNIPGLSGAQVAKVQVYLRQVEPLAQTMLTH